LWNKARGGLSAAALRATVAFVPRIPRSALADGAYHVTARGVNGAPIVVDDLDRLFFASLLRGTATLFEWVCHAWCLMTNHFHLVVEAPQVGLSGGMKRINQFHAQRFNTRHDRSGHLFQGRFAAELIADDDYLEAVCEYVLGNPVRAGLTQRPEDWRWSGLGPPSFGAGSALRRPGLGLRALR
jgi:putative transposase